MSVEKRSLASDAPSETRGLRVACRQLPRALRGVPSPSDSDIVTHPKERCLVPCQASGLTLSKDDPWGGITVVRRNSSARKRSPSHWSDSQGKASFLLLDMRVEDAWNPRDHPCPPEECYPGTLSDGRSPIAASAEGGNRGESRVFGESCPCRVRNGCGELCAQSTPVGGGQVSVTAMRPRESSDGAGRPAQVWR